MPTTPTTTNRPLDLAMSITVEQYRNLRDLVIAAAQGSTPERLAAALGVLEGDLDCTANLDDEGLQHEYDLGRNVGAKLPNGVDNRGEEPVRVASKFVHHRYDDCAERVSGDTACVDGLECDACEHAVTCPSCREFMGLDP